MSGQIIEHNGKFYREVKRKAEIGDLVKVVHALPTHAINTIGGIYTVTDDSDDTCYDMVEEHCIVDNFYALYHDQYVVLEPIEPETDAPTGPQTQHEAIANLALKVAKLIEKVDAQEAAIDEILSRLGHVEADLDEPSAPMAELQLAILRADLPLDLRLDLIRESERLRSERLEKIAQLRAMDE